MILEGGVLQLSKIGGGPGAKEGIVQGGGGVILNAIF